MLAAALPVAAALGIECLLLTCDADNVGSRKVINANGGLLQDQRGNKLRFWVPTTEAASIGTPLGRGPLYKDQVRRQVRVTTSPSMEITLIP